MAFLFCVILTFSLPLAISANVLEGKECDVSHGEIYLSGTKVADYAACKQACLDTAGCQSVTFYHHGGCSLFSTKCEATKASGNARSELVRELGGLYGKECDTAQGEIWLSGSEGLADLAACKTKCENEPGCQSVTFYHHGGCSLFSSKCENTKVSAGAHSAFVKELQGSVGKECDVQNGEIYLSESTQADFDACKRSCEDDAHCQSITFYRNTGGCALFATKCDKMRDNLNANAELVKEIQGPAQDQCEIDGTCTVARGEECDRSQGEFYMNEGSAKLSYEACKQACLDRPKCQSITYFIHGWCSLFSTQCTKRQACANAQSVTLRADFFNHQECDTGNGEVLVSQSSSNQPDLASCRKSCDDAPLCKSMTYFKSGWCSHYSTCCENRKPSPTGTADAVKSQKCVDACVIENGGCDPRRSCTSTEGVATCGDCPAGLNNDGAKGCKNPDPCKKHNGGCDSKRACSNTNGVATCGNCPAGFTNDGARACKPVPPPPQPTIPTCGFAGDVYLRIDGLKGGIINLGEITAYDKNGQVIKPSSIQLSSQHDSKKYPSRMCLDGIRSAKTNANFCHTKAGDRDPSVVLKYSGADLRKFNVYNRNDCCQSRIVGANFQICTDKNCREKILFSGKFAKQQNDYNFNLFPKGCRDEREPPKPLCGFADNVYLRIDGLKGGIINLGEITAYDKNSKVIKPSSIQLSSQHDSKKYPSRMCLDGIRSAKTNDNFCHTAASDKDPSVVLKYSGADLRKFNVYNRNDCCQSRIVGANFQICTDKNCAVKVLFSGKFAKQQNEYNFDLFPKGCRDERVPTDPCDTNNGGCHSKRKCTNTNGAVSCGNCAAGYHNDGATGCKEGPKCLLAACRQGSGASPSKPGIGGHDNDCCGGKDGGCDAGYTHSFVTNAQWAKIPGGRPAGFAPNCAGGNTCCTKGGGACNAGFYKDGIDCKSKDGCKENNGGCHAKRKCTSTGNAKVTCGSCKGPFTNSGAKGCKGVLVSLRIDSLHKTATTGAGKILNLDEVTALDQNGNVFRPTYAGMSSEHSGSYRAGNCKDGKGGSSSVCHSNTSDKDPWLLFRYTPGSHIKKIVVLNRSDCCGDRIVGATIRICINASCDGKNTIYSAKFSGNKNSYTFNVNY